MPDLTYQTTQQSIEEYGHLSCHQPEDLKSREMRWWWWWL